MMWSFLILDANFLHSFDWMRLRLAWIDPCGSSVGKNTSSLNYNNYRKVMQILDIPLKPLYTNDGRNLCVEELRQIKSFNRPTVTDDGHSSYEAYV